ncbi:MAG: hypothetical protein QXX99_04235 [Candidatus Bathyarchaeia archaeon]
MCLLKVYVEDAERGERFLISGSVAHVSSDEEVFKILDIDGGEKIISGVSFLMIDAINSIFVLRVKGELKVKG